MKKLGMKIIALFFIASLVIMPNTKPVKALDITTATPINQIFTDETLAIKIANTLGVSINAPVTQTDLNSITTLSCYGQTLTSIEGIQYLNGLTELNFESVKGFTDWNLLSNLTNLTSLDLSQSGFNDLSIISGLVNLTNLNLQNDEITDFTPLSSLVNLNILNLGGTDISDLGFISNLTKLTKLDLFGNYDLVDVMPLSNLVNLEELGISGTAVTDITSLSTLTRLKIFYFGYSQIADISVCKNFVSLEKIYFPEAQVSDLTPLANLTNLTYIYAYRNKISDLTPLANLTNLTFLELYLNQVSDLKGIENLKNLEYLGLEANKVEDISILANLTSLKDVVLYSNQISDISPLSKLPNLMYLRVSMQDIILPNQTVSPNFSLENVVISFDGSKVTPDTISDGGVYSDGKIVWTNLSGQTFVTYTFYQKIEFNGKVNGFDGTVTLPITISKDGATVVVTPATGTTGDTNTPASTNTPTSTNSSSSTNIVTPKTTTPATGITSLESNMEVFAGLTIISVIVILIGYKKRAINN